jgi:hypothetical protein
MKHGFDQNKWGTEGGTYHRLLRCEESNKKRVDVKIFGEGLKVWRRRK